MKTRINLIIAIFLMCIVHLNTGWNETVDRNIKAKAALKTNQSNTISIQGENKSEVSQGKCPDQNFSLTHYGEEIWSSDAFKIHFLGDMKSYPQLTPTPLCIMPLSAIK